MRSGSAGFGTHLLVASWWVAPTRIRNTFPQPVGGWRPPGFEQLSGSQLVGGAHSDSSSWCNLGPAVQARGGAHLSPQAAELLALLTIALAGRPRRCCSSALHSLSHRLVFLCNSRHRLVVLCVCRVTGSCSCAFVADFGGAFVRLQCCGVQHFITRESGHPSRSA